MVVTASAKHAERIRAAVETAFAGRSDVADFVSRDTAEPFAVLTLEESVAESRDRVDLLARLRAHQARPGAQRLRRPLDAGRRAAADGRDDPRAALDGDRVVDPAVGLRRRTARVRCGDADGDPRRTRRALARGPPRRSRRPADPGRSPASCAASASPSTCTTAACCRSSPSTTARPSWSRATPRPSASRCASRCGCGRRSCADSAGTTCACTRSTSTATLRRVAARIAAMLGVAPEAPRSETDTQPIDVIE